LNKLLRNEQGRLRNGWWIVLFIVVFLASQLAYHPVSKGLQQVGAGKGWLAPLPVGFLLLVTWICLRLRGEPLSGVGLRLDANWLRQIVSGAAFGAALMLAVTALIFLAGGVRFEFDPARGPIRLAAGAWLFIWAAVLEELLFRGFVFQRLIDGIGVTAALLVMGGLFAIAHWGNPSMEGSTMIWATIDTVLGAVLLGLAYLRTGSLALPIGIHFGWNWAQGSLLGFDVSGFSQSGWLVPHLLAKPEWFTGGAFGPEASIFSIVVDAAAVFLLCRWKGVARSARAVPRRSEKRPEAASQGGRPPPMRSVGIRCK
jgi:membrane protease YdiL (CAAX protease family)